MGKKLLIAIALLSGMTWSSAAVISGKVQDQMNKTNIGDALVILLRRSEANFSRTVVSDQTGYFILTDVTPGVYTIEVARDGYFKNVLFDLKIEREQNYTINVKLLKMEGKSASDYCFMLGGIEVCSVQEELIPEQPVTTRKIDSGEIEHMQATSLGDIISLVPGVDKAKNPGLSDAQNIGIRSVSAASYSLPALEYFGVAVVVDGNQLSTNANATSKISGSSGETGLDLRNIPAENIKSVEVITGIPSVEYGNFATGVIKVETKAGRTAPKLNAKINPDTKSASFSHGIRLGNQVLDYHLNYAYSERNLRKEGDEFHRLHFSGNLTNQYLQGRLENRLNASYTKTFDNEKPTDVERTRSYNRGYLATVNYSFDYQKSAQDRLKGSIGINLNNKNAFRSKWVAENYNVYHDTTVIDTVILPGDTAFVPRDTSMLEVLPGYIGKYREVGQEWQISAKLQRRLIRQGRFGKHELLIGAEGNYEKNTGPGLLLDEKYPYYGQYSSRRSYAFSDYPDLPSLTAYVEDIFSGRLFKDRYTLMGGLRYDVFSPTGFGPLRDGHLLSSKHGEFLSPRVNLQYFFSDDVRLRLGWGKSVKAISLGYIYKPPAYFKYQKDTLIIEEEQIQYNPHLKAYSIDKTEISWDWKISDLFGFSATGYYQTSDNMPAGVDYPWGYAQNPDTITTADWSRFENLGWSRSSGVEITLRTQRLRSFQYRMNVTYRFSKSGRHGLAYDSGWETSWEDLWYKPAYSWSEKVILDYQVNYISNRLGVWITLDAQHIPLEHHKTVYRSNSTYKTVDGQVYLWYQGMSYYFDRYLDDSGGRWIINFRITKSLTQNAEVSLFINNLLDDRAPYKSWQGLIYEENPPIFYGLEVSAQW